MNHRLLGASAVFVWAVIVSVCPSFGETVRVTSWNLQLQPGATAETREHLRKEAVETLRKLEPDVILLQGVRDLAMCWDLAQALRPADFSVASCSSLHSALTTESNALQVAILTKNKAYFTTAEPWRFQGEIKLPGGYTFAALQRGEHRLGVFSLQMGEQQMPALTVRQLLDELGNTRRWEVNRPEVFLIAGTLNTFSKPSASVYETLTRLLEEAGFADGLIDLPPTERTTLMQGTGQGAALADFILIETNATAINPRIVTTSVSEHYPLTCDVELKPRGMLPAKPENVQMAGNSNGLAASEEVIRKDTISQLIMAHLPGRKVVGWFGGMLGGLVLLCILIWCRTRPKPVVLQRAPARLHAGVELDGRAAPASYTVIIAPGSVTGSASPPNPAASMLKPVIQVEPPGATQTHSAGWQQRALAAEHQVAQAEAALRVGLISQLSQWLKQKLVRKLMADRSQLLAAQEEAARRALKVDERLNRIEQQIQQQNQAYERRIEELNRQLLVAKEENRELIRIRIAQIKMEMEQARLRLLAQEENEGVEG